MANEPWLKYQGQSGGLPAFQVPQSAGQIAEEQRRIRDQQIQERNAAIAEGNASRDSQTDTFKIQNQQGQQNFDRSTKLSDDFSARPAVKAFRNAIPSFESALRTKPTPEGDLSLVYSFAKIMDPDSVVREGEAESVVNSSPYAQQIVARLQKEMGEGGIFTEDARRRLRNELTTRIKSLNTAYLSSQSDFLDRAGAAGVDPELVVGTHPGEAMLKALRADGIVGGEKSPQNKPDQQPAAAPMVKDDGTIEVTEPDGTISIYPNQKIYEARLQQNRGLSGTVSDESDLGRRFAMGLGDLAEGAGDVLGIVGNPLNAALNYTGIPQALGGSPLSTDLGQVFRDATGTPAPETASENLASAINKGGIGGLSFAGLAGQAAPLATGVTQQVLQRVAAAPAVDAISGMTGAASGEGARQAGAGPIGQIAASLAGGGVGALGSGGIGSLASRYAAPVGENALLAAGRRQNVEPLPADVGGPTTRRLTSAAAQSPLSAAPVVNASQRAQTQLGDAAASTARQTGTILPPDEAGLLARQGAEIYSKQSSQRGRALYERAEKASQGVKIKPNGAVQTIDAEIARLSETPEVNAPLISELQKFRESLAQSGGISVSGLRDVRSIAGKAAHTEALRSTPAKVVLGRVSDALSQDISAGLQQAGRNEANRAFKVADTFWKDRVEQIDKVLEPIVGSNRSGEQILQSIEGMGQGKSGGVRRLARLMATLPDEEAADIQATIIDRLGRATAGQQNADGTAFAASTFLTNWNRLSPKGKAVLFPRPEIRRNLDDIATLAGGMREAQRYANASNSAGGIAGQVMLSGGAGVAGGFPGLVAASAIQYLSGKALTSRALTNWVAKAPKIASPNGQRAYIDRLATIAAREPALASDIQGLQQAMLRVANDNAGQMTGAAASPGNDEEQR